MPRIDQTAAEISAKMQGHTEEIEHLVSQAGGVEFGSPEPDNDEGQSETPAKPWQQSSGCGTILLISVPKSQEHGSGEKHANVGGQHRHRVDTRVDRK